CQDNEIGWVDWSRLGNDDEDMTALLGRLTQLRGRFPQLQGHHWLDGLHPDGSYDVLWLTPDAAEMTDEDWRFPNGYSLSYVPAPTNRGHVPLFPVLNAAPHAMYSTLPSVPESPGGTRAPATSSETLKRGPVAAATRLVAPERSVLVF